MTDTLPALDPSRDRDEDTRIVKTILSLIGGGFSEGRRALAATAAEQTGVPYGRVLTILDQYAGTASGSAYWSVRRGRKRQCLYAVLPTH